MTFKQNTISGHTASLLSFARFCFAKIQEFDSFNIQMCYKMSSYIEANKNEKLKLSSLKSSDDIKENGSYCGF